MMKRVLWVCNIMLPAIAQELNLPYSNREGWLSGIFEKVKGREESFKLGVCFPVNSFKELPVQDASVLNSWGYGFDIPLVRVKGFSLSGMER